MHLVEEKIGVTVVVEVDELLLDFCRLAGGAVDELFEVDILLKIRGEQISEVASRCDRKPRNGFLTNGAGIPVTSH
jgi:hypothetical protein